MTCSSNLEQIYWKRISVESIYCEVSHASISSIWPSIMRATLILIISLAIFLFTDAFVLIHNRPKFQDYEEEIESVTETSVTSKSESKASKCKNSTLFKHDWKECSFMLNGLDPTRPRIVLRKPIESPWNAKKKPVSFSFGLLWLKPFLFFKNWFKISVVLQNSRTQIPNFVQNPD